MVNCRPRGILSDSDRRFLQATEDEQKEDYTAPARSQRWSAIRERLEAGVYDLALLWEHLGDDERQRVFGRPGPAKGAADAEELLDSDQELEQAIEDAIAFLYLAARDTGRDQRELAERAIHTAEERSSPHAVDVTLDVERLRLEYFAENARRKIDTGEPLEDVEIRAALEEGVIPPDRVAAYIRGEWDGSSKTE